MNTTISSIPGFHVILSFHLISTSPVDHRKACGGTRSGVAEKAQTWLCLTNTWALPSGDQVTLPLSISFMKWVGGLAKARACSSRTCFSTTLVLISRLPFLATYGDAQVTELVKVSKKYDPKGVFQKLAKGGFTLP